MAKSLQDPSVGAANADVETLASRFGIGFDPWVFAEILGGGTRVPSNSLTWQWHWKKYEGNDIYHLYCTWWLHCALRLLSSHLCFSFAHHRREFHGSKNDIGPYQQAYASLKIRILPLSLTLIASRISYPAFHAITEHYRRRCATFVPHWQREQLLIPGESIGGVTWYREGHKDLVGKKHGKGKCSSWMYSCFVFIFGCSYSLCISCSWYSFNCFRMCIISSWTFWNRWSQCQPLAALAASNHWRTNIDAQHQSHRSHAEGVKRHRWGLKSLERSHRWGNNTGRVNEGV